MRRLYILRPEPGASATAGRAAELGLEARALPLFEVVPVEWEAPAPSAFDAILLTSANAVRNAGEKLEQLTALSAYAVGDATAAAASQAGFRIAGVGEGGVRALLDGIPGRQRLLHICGEDRTGADGSRHWVTQLSVYRAEPLPVGGELRELDGQVAAVHSPRAARRLAELVEPRNRSSIRLAAISKAAAVAAGLGWRKCEWAGYPSDSALLALAARLCEEGG